MAVDLRRSFPGCAEGGFILIGGMAAILHGSARVTFDVDVVYSRAHASIERLTTALAPHCPTFATRNRVAFTLATDS